MRTVVVLCDLLAVLWCLEEVRRFFKITRSVQRFGCFEYWRVLELASIRLNLLHVLIDILIKWRRHRYVFTNDIKKMYRQILAHEKDRDLQQVLWRRHSSKLVSEYLLNNITYSLSCSPFLAMCILHQLAADKREITGEN